MRGKLLGVALLGLGSGVALAQDPGSAQFYTEKVVPVLEANCYRCHGGTSHRGGLTIDTKAGMLKGGHDGPVLVPGHPESSLIVKLIRHEGPANDPMPMPPNKPKLSDADIAVVEQWVKAGAITPGDVTATH
ncbi:MAG TPA: c-type cytochrome domain-containing protein [Granulicella sp.]|jgi:cytochrome c|nr:c-type cytochrome domain-containing protein [Granulicella sp.]